MASLLEAIGIGLIGPFLNLASYPESVHNNAFLAPIYKQTGLQTARDFIVIAGLFISIVFCVKSLTYFFVKRYIYEFASNLKAQLCSRLMHTYLSVPYVFFLSKNTATIIKNIVMETDKVCYDYVLPLLEGCANTVVTIVLILLLAKTDLIFLAVTSAVILPVIIIFYQFRKSFRRWGEQASQARKEMVSIINHSLGSIKETRIIGCERYFESKMYEQGRKYAKSESLFKSSQIIPRVAIESILVLFLILLVCVNLVLFNKGLQDILPILSVFVITSLRLVPSASQSIAAISYVQNTAYSLDIIYKDLRDTELYQDGKAMKEISSVKNFETREDNNKIIPFVNQVNLKNISYSYPNAEYSALSNISLTLKKGESIALIGKSGAGKTTLVDLILGLLQPTSGDICVDGTSIYQDISSWQNLVAYIPQSIFLIDDTIEKNIAFGVPEHLIDQKRLKNAIEAAQITEFINQLPDGINTVVGERGVRLSGGQRQRVGIARALYNEREILILDEATSALDNETEALVTEAIRALSGSKTMIIIAHRLTTVEHCDRLYMLKEGHIVKSGTYKEVVLEEAYSQA
ncbi:ABC transporter ATP-binding protein [Dulcicalothrix desertica PCC 7102]|uniref:ABC transporter ATP-binding protein n=2 Tax=Dulcicalothrix desertica TaxID=32056 RepID=A0A3S1CNU7_9CYAN|nr:ABC transporter ATP-binding protein [Dulcicalothrix desertica PCC 7102]